MPGTCSQVLKQNQVSITRSQVLKQNQVPVFSKQEQSFPMNNNINRGRRKQLNKEEAGPLPSSFTGLSSNR
jgi:hypothetical protein